MIAGCQACAQSRSLHSTDYEPWPITLSSCLSPSEGAVVAIIAGSDQIWVHHQLCHHSLSFTPDTYLLLNTNRLIAPLWLHLLPY